MSSNPRQYRRAAIVAAGLSLHMLFAAAQSPRPLLKKYIANPDTDALLREPAVQSQLRALVGKQLPHLMRNLDVRSDVELRSGALALVGNAAHGGGLEEGIVCIADHGPTPLVEAAIFSKGKIALYAKASQYQHLTVCIKDWITQVNSGHRDRFSQPRNVRLAKP